MAEPLIQSALQPETQRHFLLKYVFSTDHKVIGVQYYLLGFLAVGIGTLLSILMRLHLAWPQAAAPLLGRLWPLGAPGGIITPEFYLSLLTLHGTLMIFFVLTSVPLGAFGNYFLPLQIGAHEMAFPRLNMLSFWLTLSSLLILLSTLVIADGPPISGWTAYPPLSAVGSIAGPGEGSGQVLWLVSMAVFCVGSLLSALNFIVTTLVLRSRGMTLMRMPLTAWAWFISAVLVLFCFAVLFAADILLLFDKLGGTSFFIPTGLVVSDQAMTQGGGSPLLWQHLFWFFGHPEVYITILPGMNITSHVLSVFSRKPVFGLHAAVYASIAIAVLSFTVWGHHMFASGMNPFMAMSFTAFTMVIAVPSAVTTLSWLGTLWGGKIRLSAAMLFAIGFVSLFVSGGLSGLLLAQPPLDLYLHGTYFVVAHFHIVMAAAGVFGIFSGTYFWFPKIVGRMMNEPLGRLHFWVTFIGVYCTFMPMHFLGLAGEPRRYANFSGVPIFASMQHLHVFISAAAFVTLAGQSLFVLNFFWSMRMGQPSGQNPWDACSLEWTVPSPPPRYNFRGECPTVWRSAYEYSVPGAFRDYIMQDESEAATGSPQQPGPLDVERPS